MFEETSNQKNTAQNKEISQPKEVSQPKEMSQALNSLKDKSFENPQASMKDPRFSGVSRLLGDATFELLEKTHVMVIGVGGVGSWSCEALVRSGLGKLTLVDLDDICVTNINRQLPALTSTVGRQKIDALGDRLMEINPGLDLIKVHDFYNSETSKELLAKHPDFVIDAIDGVANKAFLIANCLKMNQAVIVCGAAGGRIDPTQIRTSDLLNTTKDKMLKTIRSRLKKEYGLSLEGNEIGIDTVYSVEPPRYPTSKGGFSSKPEIKSFGLDCKGGMGSASFVTGAFGFAAASIVIQRLESQAYKNLQPSKDH